MTLVLCAGMYLSQEAMFVNDPVIEFRTTVMKVHTSNEQCFQSVQPHTVSRISPSIVHYRKNALKRAFVPGRHLAN